MKIDIHTQLGETNGQIELNPKVFENSINNDLIHQALVLQLANKRIAIAHTKTKGEIRGGGKKPYAQKHTGRARQGSTRNPHFIGGGIAFGPRSNRNYKLDMPRKQRKKALFSALSSKAVEKQIIVLDKYTPPQDKNGKEMIKTKSVQEMIDKLKIGRKGLFVLPEKNKNFQKASQNIPNMKSILVNYLNIYDILNHTQIVFFKDSLKKLDEIFLKEKEEKS